MRGGKAGRMGRRGKIGIGEKRDGAIDAESVVCLGRAGGVNKDGGH